MSKQSLPSNFSARVCLKEVQLQTMCNFQVITELVGLYQQAIEYFEAKGDPRQGEFQRKLEEMLVRPDVVGQLEEQRPQKSQEAPPRVQEKPSHSYDGILEKHVEGTLKSLSDTKRDLKQQHSALLLRLQRRAKHSVWKDHSPQSDSSTDDMEVFFKESISPISSPLQGTSPLTSPRGQEHPSSSHFDKLEVEYDRIMEESYTDKTQVVSEIRDKYKEQLVELEAEIESCGGNQLLEQVVSRMKEEMDQEIQQAVAVIESRRKELLRELKERYRQTPQ